MAYRVMVGGVPIECDSKSEAIALAKDLAHEEAAAERRARRTGSGASGPRPKDSEVTVPPVPSEANGSLLKGTNGERKAVGEWNPPTKLAGFMDRLNELQQCAVALIATSRGEVPLEKIRTSLGLQTTRDASIMIASCKRIARENGLNWSQIATFRITGKGEERRSSYSAGPLLRGEATA
jgi:hypothetical protein